MTRNANLAEFNEALAAFREHVRLLEVAGKAWREISQEAEQHAERLHAEVQRLLKKAAESLT